jgi:hypothetical protein
MLANGTVAALAGLIIDPQLGINIIATMKITFK